ncbi:MAG: hypothetical protein ACRDHZ_10485 [Ktedonobacteraceae bacterium]
MGRRRASRRKNSALKGCKILREKKCHLLKISTILGAQRSSHPQHARRIKHIQFGKRAQRRNITQILVGLLYAYRTAVFSSHGGQVAFWYVRLRWQEEVEYPLMGVVKVEVPRPDRTPIEAERADLISRALVAERNVTPHGRDQRWHCHLYPVFQAEQAIKNRFYSQQVLMGMIRWSSTVGSPIYFQEALL